MPHSDAHLDSTRHLWSIISVRLAWKDPHGNNCRCSRDVQECKRRAWSPEHHTCTGRVCTPATDSWPAESGRAGPGTGTQPRLMMPSRMSSSTCSSSVSPVSYTTWQCLLFSCACTTGRFQANTSSCSVKPGLACCAAASAPQPFHGPSGLPTCE